MDVKLLPEGWKRTMLVLGTAAVVLGGLVVISGVIPVKASAGHWPVTRWFLGFARGRSVWTHSLGVEVPDLGDRARIARGAGHYETACRVCHGAPGLDRAVTMTELTPHPPHLESLVPDRSHEELFYVVKHGIKMTAMPAWPAREREDEVWDVVAFLRELPEMDSATYRRLAYGEGDAPYEARHGETSGTPPPFVEARCVRCHGRDGRGRDGAFPRLAGQKPAYLELSLDGYAARRRFSGIMQAVVADAEPDQLAAAARHYAALPAASALPDEAEPAPPEVIERGRHLAHAGIPENKVPTCVSCHGPDGAEERNATYPYLSGQPASYLARQLELFREGRRGASAYAHVMELSAGGLSPEDAEAVAAYYASLEP